MRSFNPFNTAQNIRFNEPVFDPLRSDLFTKTYRYARLRLKTLPGDFYFMNEFQLLNGANQIPLTAGMMTTSDMTVYANANLIDGSTLSRFGHVVTSSVDAEIKFDLGALNAMSKVKFYIENGTGGANPDMVWEFALSKNDSTYDVIGNFEITSSAGTDSGWRELNI